MPFSVNIIMPIDPVLIGILGKAGAASICAAARVGIIHAASSRGDSSLSMLA
jgi:hypothetical protein